METLRPDLLKEMAQVSYRRGPYKRKAKNTMVKKTYRKRMLRRNMFSKKLPGQIQALTWSGNKQPVTITEGGGVTLITAFPQGNDEGNRHTNTTYTNALLIKAQLSLAYDNKAYTGTFKVHWWIVYDKNPPQSNPVTSDIFDCFYVGYPGTWYIRRDQSDRLSIKSYWTTTLTSNGYDNTKGVTAASGVFPDRRTVTMHKFIGRLKAKTVWNPSKTTAEVASIKSGALYVVVAPDDVGYGPGVGYDYKIKVNIAACMRVYFRSVGNQ